MRILLSGYHNPHYLTVTEYIERAIRQLGHELIVFNDRDHILPGRLRERLPLLQAISLAEINRRLVRLALRTRPDLILVTGGHRIMRGALNRLRGHGFHLVLWTTDHPRSDDRMQTTAALFHHVFCQGSEYVDIFRRRGIRSRWLPMACDPELHRPVAVSMEDRARYGAEVVFVGSYYPWRAELLSSLPGVELAIWGPGWEQLPLDSPLRASLRGAHTPPDAWVKIYGCSKVVLALHIDGSAGCGPVYQASPRVFEALGCGAFVIADSQRDVLSLFEDAKHLVVFRGTQDLRSKVAYFLSDDDARRPIAAAGRHAVLQDHTYVRRIAALLEAVDRAPVVHRSAAACGKSRAFANGGNG
ncbi:MAG: glycosyltransferase [Desulfobacterales bacterium]|jgi:spore maturation protein CgeB|nr:glycosyltransferase [Desulfobacterales bacterium]